MQSKRCKTKHAGRTVSAASRKQDNSKQISLLEVLEERKLFAAAPNFIAVLDTTQNFGNSRRAVAYYDVSGLADYTGNQFFNQTPDFVVWTGYEDTLARNFEDPQAITVNPATGETYVLAFDSGSPGVADNLGDTQGDYDLYEFNVSAIYSDYITNHRAKGTMYAPRVTVDGYDYGATKPAVTASSIGVPAGRDNTDGVLSNDIVFLPNIIQKVGEVARYGASGSTPFFNQQDLQFVDSNTLLLMENRPAPADPLNPDNGPLTSDYSIRTIERVSNSTGQAATHANDTGGYNNQTTQSWESFAWNGDNFVDLDNNAGTGALSDVDGMRYVERDGVKGVWVSDRDGGGDDVRFFALNFATRTATKTGGFALDKDPSANDNSGSLDWFDVDQNGRLILSESGFFETPQTEPNLVTTDITSYTGNITFGSSSVKAKLAPTVDDDADVTNGQYGVYDRGQNYVYYFDTDSVDPNNAQTVVSDVYVVDASTGAVVYQELNAVNSFFPDANSIRTFTLGDFAHQDGVVNTDDVDALAARINDPTAGGKYTAATGAEMFDLTGDKLLTTGDVNPGTVNGDMDYLIHRILGTEYGDTDLNGSLDFDDFSNTQFGSLTHASGWANGDFDGNSSIDFDDISILQFSFLVNSQPTRI